MDLYKKGYVFDTDILKPGAYISFKQIFRCLSVKSGIIVYSDKIKIKVAVYDESSKNENKLDIYTLNVDDRYDISIHNIS